MIHTSMTDKEVKENRIGWDLLIDIDCKYLEYSKKAAYAIVEALKKNGVKNIGVKFSVIGDTPVLIKQEQKVALIPIKEAINLFKTSKNLEILSLDKNKKLKFSKVYDFLEHKDAIYEIAHENSKIPVKATAHHSVFVFDKKGIVEKKVTELKKGDFLVTFNAKNNPLKSNLISVKNIFEFSKNKFIKNIFHKDITINGSLMRLLGYYLAEGHVTNVINQVGFSFNKNETDYIEDCTYLLKNLTNRNISIRHPNPNSTQILIHSKEWATFFETICGKSKTKHLPFFAWTSEKELFMELLKGYLRGDAHKIGKYTLAAKSVVPQMVREFVWLCKLNGISCSLSTEYNKPHRLPQGNMFKGSFVYILNIPKSEINMPEFSVSRNKFSPYPRERTFPIKFLKEVYNQIKPKKFLTHRPEQVTLRKERANLERIKKVITWFKTTNSVDFDSNSNEIISNYESLMNSDVGVVKIKDIKKTSEELVYDVSVEETESFFGNDYPILLHNSGGKGFHIIVPSKAFPENMSGKKTCDMFPEWPRQICYYLKEQSRPFLEAEMANEDLGESNFKVGVRCEKCKNIAETKEKIIFVCPLCKNKLEAHPETIVKKRIIRCPDAKCGKQMVEEFRESFYNCSNCNINSKRSPDSFKTMKQFSDIFAILGLDLVLVSSRHLFRMPYSLHEKTSLASVVIDPNKILEFEVKDADPLRITALPFMPDSEENEAFNLLRESLEMKLPEIEEKKVSYDNLGEKKFNDVTITNLTPDLYPPSIQKILAGMPTDGRKRGLFILLSFFTSLKISFEQIASIIDDWNKKNYEPLKSGYIKAQLSWYSKTNPKLPPNFDKPFYKEIGIFPSPEEIKTKNPVSYTIKKAFSRGQATSNAKK